MKRLLLIALACAACTNPDELLAVQGTVTSADSVEGQLVRLVRRRAAGFGRPCGLPEPFKEMQTNADGAFEFEVFRLETRDACFHLEATFPSQSVASTDVHLFGATTTAAPLLDWRANPSLDGGVLHFNPPVPWPDDLPPTRMGNVYRLGVQLTHHEEVLTSDGGVIWQADDRSALPDASFESLPIYRRDPLLMDELRLEDFEGTLTMKATLSVPDQPSRIDSAGSSPLRMTAGQTLALRGTRVPLSRGLACPELGTPCPLTDGDLTNVDAGFVGAVTLHLPSPAMVSAVVLRDAWVGNGLIRVLITTEDGGIGPEVEHTLPKPDYQVNNGFPDPRFSQQFLADGGYISIRQGYVVIPLDGGTPSSRVTLQFPAGLSRIRELSVFE